MVPNNSNETRTLEIRKYQNRRYYDTTRSRHVGLQEIHRLIMEGYDIRVVDTQTDEDITSRILTQILLEYESVKLGVFSNELLIRAIRANDNLLKDFVDLYFRQAFEVFCASQKQFEQMLREAHHLTSAIATPGAWLQSIIPPWMRYSPAEPLLAPPAAEQPPGGSEAAASPSVAEELAALRKDIAALKAQARK
jgi:polyhydroxyalkanoate synthesis repressor PhaR